MNMSNAAAVSMQSELNVTPMIDILLALLMLFMSLITATPKGETASTPQPALDAARAPQDAAVLDCLKGTRGQTEFGINQQVVSRQNLPVRLAAIYAKRAQRVIFINGDDRLSFRQVGEVIDISHAAGLDQVGLIPPKVSQSL